MENHHNEDQNGVVDGSRSALIFLGTGCSSAVPNAMCLIQPSDPPCHVCFQSLSLPPDRNPNYRCNTSLLIDYCHSDGKHYYILIDVGKNFREQVLRWFTYHKIPQVDSIILTHEHADAVLGLDDIRAVQPYSPTNDIDPTPVYLSQYAMESIATKFPYLVRKKLIEGQEVRRVAQMEWNIIEEQVDKPFVASGLKFIPLPVMHGEDYISLGFLFGENCRVAYISDVSRFPSSTEYVISKTGAGQLDLLILDTLYQIIWYGAWMKKCSENKEMLTSAVLPLLSNISGMAILLEHIFFEAYAGESREGICVAKFSTGDIVLMNVASPTAGDLNDLCYANLALFRDHFLKMEGAVSGVCLKCQIIPRVACFYVWKSMHFCYSWILTSDYRKTMLPYLDKFKLEIKYDIFRVVFVSGSYQNPIREEQEAMVD